MNLDKSKLLLKKINRLYDLINEFGEASDTEKDLIKAYVIDLYGAVIADENEDLEEEEMRKKIKKRKKLEKKMRKKDKGLKSKKVIEEDEIIDAKEDPKPSAAPEHKKPTEPKEIKESKSVVESVKVAQSAQPIVSGKLKELFEVSNTGELSDKLSQTPVSDLTKAMGINEKIFTVNELFGGNSEEMNNMLVALNGLKSYDEAKSVLMRSVASKYDWASSGKAKKARNFIKLVQRRYN